MTFLHKLARRLAAALILVVPSLVLGCSPGEARDFLSPNPTPPSVLASITISPQVGTIRPGETIQFTATGHSSKGQTIPVDVLWSATGGTIAPDGLFTADNNGEFHISAVARTSPEISGSARVAVFTSPTDIILLLLSPDSIELAPGEGVQFQAIAKLGDGSKIQNLGLAWFTTGGTVDGGGWYVASDEGTFSVKASEVGGVEGSAKAYVRKRTVVIEQILVTPGVATISAGDSAQFVVTARWSDGTSSPANSVSWKSTGGTIGGSGVYAAGSTPGNYSIIAKYKNGVLADTAFVSVTEPTMIGLRANPGQVILSPSATQQYSAHAAMSDGTEREVGAKWQASGGQVSSSGLFTAPAVDGSYRVIAGVAGTALADTSLVTVSVSVAALTALVSNPSSANIPAGSSRQFSVTSLYSDGSTRVPAVTWQATGGSITAAGLFTAGSTQGTYRVIASDVGTAVADTSVVLVTPPALQSLTLDPPSVELRPGESRGFTVTGAWSDGSTAPPTIVWTAFGGTMTSNGVFTAGDTEGTFTAVASHSASGLADTSYVTVVKVASPPPVLTSLTVSPSFVILGPGEVLQFRPSVQWSDGSTAPPTLTWSATGGTVSGSGVFAAGPAEGSYRVIASHGGGLADTAQVQVSASAPALSSIAVSPKDVTLQVNGVRQFAVSGTRSDGSSSTPSVTWSASAGIITNGGLYAAPGVAGSQHIVAQAIGSSLVDTAIVTVTSPTALVALVVSPDTTQIGAGASVQFSVTGLYSNGGSAVPPVVWSATGGTITSSGLYAAGVLAGTFRVVATSGSVADTAWVEVNGAQLTGFHLAPDSAMLSLGASVQFTAALTWSDGQSHPASVTYSATGGTITVGGLYTGGNTVGKFLVVASCACGVVDSSVVAIAAQAKSLQSIVISPSSTSVTPGAVLQFSVTGIWDDGSTSPVSATFSASAGSIDASGLYTAPSQAMSDTIVARESGGLADTASVTVAQTAGLSIPLTVYRFDGSTTAVLVSNGLPLPPGALRASEVGLVRILTAGVELPAYVEALKGTHPDGSLRAIMIQFTQPADPFSRSHEAQVGVPSSVPRTQKAPSSGIVSSAVALPMSADYLVSTGIMGTTTTRSQAPSSPTFYPKYETDFDKWSDWQWAQYGAGWEAADYYDRTFNHYAFWVRTGNVKFWERATRLAVDYRVNYLEKNAYGASPRWALLDGLAVHYWLTGDEKSREAVYKTAVRLETFGGSAMANTTSHPWMEGRIQSRVLGAKLIAMRLESPAWSTITDWRIASRGDLGYILTSQSPDGSYRFNNTCGESLNYMTGMLNSVLSAYYDDFEPDARIPSAIKRSLDWLWSTQWRPADRVFNYYSGNCPGSGGVSPGNDLNGLFVKSWGWYGSYSKDQTYFSQGEEIFRGGVEKSWLQGSKQFNQLYYNSWQFLGYR